MPVELELPDDREDWLLGVMLAERFDILELAPSIEMAEGGWIRLTASGAALLTDHGIGTGPQEKAAMIETWLKIAKDVAAQAGAPERWKEVAYYLLSASKEEVSETVDMARQLREKGEESLHSAGDDLSHGTV